MHDTNKRKERNVIYPLERFKLSSWESMIEIFMRIMDVFHLIRLPI